MERSGWWRWRNFWQYGNSGSSLSCSSTVNVTRNINHNNKIGGASACHGGEYEVTRNPIGSIRNRCRGRGSRRAKRTRMESIFQEWLSLWNGITVKVSKAPPTL